MKESNRLQSRIDQAEQALTRAWLIMLTIAMLLNTILIKGV